MEQFLLESSDYLLKFAGAATIIAVGVMSVLLPILVFRISWKTSKANKKMDKILALLNEQVQLAQKIEANTRKPEETSPPDMATIQKIQKMPAPVEQAMPVAQPEATNEQ